MKRHIRNPDQMPLFTSEQLDPSPTNVAKQSCLSALAILMKDVPLPRKKQRRHPYH